VTAGDRPAALDDAPLPSRPAAAMIAAAASPALVLALAVGAGDPRPALVELQLAHRTENALAATDRALAAGGEPAAALGLDYLRGHLLDCLGRRREASEAFGRAMVAAPRLELHSRYRMAVDQERFGHPEVAAGLVATVVATAPPSPLLDAATELLVRDLAAGGDCRLLGGIDRARLAAANRRRLEVAAADCARDGQPERARALYLAVLRENREDEPARRAAEQLGRLAGERPPGEVALLLGRTFHWHRRFDRSIPYLEEVTAELGLSLTGESFETVYTLVRGRFWQEDYPTAATGFADLAARTADRRRQGLALYQQARAEELAGRWPQAAATYRAAYRADPLGRTADSALAGALRIEWRQGAEAGADEVYGLLVGQRPWIPTAARASLFLAASDLAQGRRDRAGRWLELAERAGRAVETEVAYWRGRLAELDGEPAAAVGQYLRVAQRDLFHPLAGDARRRLGEPPLAAAARAEGRRLAGSERAEDGYGAWLLLGDASPAGRAALGRFRARLAADRFAGPILALAPVPIERWPLWQAALREPEEMLLGLGIWSEGAPAVARHFPLVEPDLALTGGALLAHAGETRRAIGRAELLRRRGARLPPPLVPAPLRRLLHPFAYSELVVAESLRRGVDPYLLAAVLREESRFDPRALSTASARGLAQFVAPTAVQLGRRLGLGEVTADDLYRPEISIALGAAHLRELRDLFGGAVEPAIASYNAGAPQARLWRDHCFTGDPAEYLTKVSFAETRAYLERVLRSWAEYRDLYQRRRGPGDQP
jgi:soluble lytic murein transglycosylase